MEKENIISRRNFFKRSASLVLPALAMVTIPSILTSCEIEEDFPEIPSGCKSGCSGKCSGICGAACQNDCSGSCAHGCKGNCKGSCSGSGCRSLCTGKTRY